MLQYVFRPQNGTKYSRCLFNNRGVRNDIDYPPEAMPLGMSQGKGKGSYRLSASGGNRKGKQTHLLRIPRPDARLQNFAALPIQLSLRRKPAR